MRRPFSQPTGTGRKGFQPKHGLIKHPLYSVWGGMKQRCNYIKHVDYHNYGGRFIEVCDEWFEFISFYEWATANGWEKGLSLDRIDNDGDYAPDNCRWVTFKVQAANRRRRQRLDVSARRRNDIGQFL